jgi:hypothetical protein
MSSQQLAYRISEARFEIAALEMEMIRLRRLSDEFKHANRASWEFLASATKLAFDGRGNRAALNVSFEVETRSRQDHRLGLRPQFCKEAAAETRRIAEQVKDPIIQREFLALASHFEQLGRQQAPKGGCR